MLSRSCLHFPLTVLLWAAGLPAHAAIYKYVDAEGNVTFTDKYRPGATKLVDTGASPVSVATPRSRAKSASQASPAGFPRVDASTQRKRDDVRRSILLEELATEEKNLATAHAALANAGKQKSATDIARLTEGVRLHEKNIEMLDKELARIR